MFYCVGHSGSSDRGTYSHKYCINFFHDSCMPRGGMFRGTSRYRPQRPYCGSTSRVLFPLGQRRAHSSSASILDRLEPTTSPRNCRVLGVISVSYVSRGSSDSPSLLAAQSAYGCGCSWPHSLRVFTPACTLNATTNSLSRPPERSDLRPPRPS